VKVLLDTTVISQLTKAKPDEGTIQWLTQIAAENLYLSVVSLFELRVGIEAMGPGKRRISLSRWLEEDVAEEYRGRILPVDEAVADRGARIVAFARSRGWNALEMDSLIAATAQVHGLAVATLNRKHFERLDVELVEF
jgi:predicted nucleic acid-binding protein